MPRELKQDRALASLDGTTRSTRPPAPPPSQPQRPGAATPRARSSEPSWFGALDPAAAPPLDRPRASRALPLSLLLAAVLLAIVVPSTALRVLLPLALALAAGALVLRARRGALPAGPLPRRRGLELDGVKLVFRSIAAPRDAVASSRQRARESGAPSRRTSVEPPPVVQSVLELAAAFGVTLLATPRRDKLVALISSAAGTFHVGAAFDAGARRAFAPLLDRATIVVNEEAGLEAIGPDGEPLLVAPDELASLLDALVEHSPTCLDRFVLTDARGAELSLDGRILCAGERKVDLGSPLEWKPIVFQESFGPAVTVYQGTWIRQGGTELVLVCLLPSLGPALGEGLDVAALDRGALRDLRLTQASPEQPPPAEQRVAIERLFMVPVRSALDRAPRAAQQASRARA